jgi:uncharacterized protein (DUF1810 family)
MTASDSFDLERFVTAQAPVFSAVLAELKSGRKRTHWMWFVFPQLRGLGYSSMATFYGIPSLHEARDYLAHPVLGSRLELCSRTVTDLESGSLHQIFGSPDDVKFQSSMSQQPIRQVPSTKLSIAGAAALWTHKHYGFWKGMTASAGDSAGGLRPALVNDELEQVLLRPPGAPLAIRGLIGGAPRRARRQQRTKLVWKFGLFRDLRNHCPDRLGQWLEAPMVGAHFGASFLAVLGADAGSLHFSQMGELSLIQGLTACCSA